MNFYMIYDMDLQRVGVSLHVNSKAQIEEKSNAWIIVLVIIIIILVGGMILYC